MFERSKHHRITTGTFEQQRGLDATGNWKAFKQDNDGNGTWELNQTRSANKMNEITGISNSVGTAWATPRYDVAGIMFGRESLAAMSGCYTASAGWQDSLALALKTLW